METMFCLDHRHQRGDLPCPACGAGEEPELQVLMSPAGLGDARAALLELAPQARPVHLAPLALDALWQLEGSD